MNARRLSVLMLAVFLVSGCASLMVDTIEALLTTLP